MTNKVGYALAIGAVYLLLELTGVDRNSAAGMPDWALIGFGMVLPAALFGLAAWAFTRIFLDDAQRELPTASA
jgi:Na+/melibiose symporter-like transporter